MRRLMLAAAAMVLSLAAVSTAPASAEGPFPDVIPLPADWNAEGIAAGPGSTIYSGSLATGAIWKGDLRTGKGAVLVPPHKGRVAVGLKYANGLLFVAGGPTGKAYVYDARNGSPVATFTLGAANKSFINDVVVTRQAAWFTDSFHAVLYRLPLRHGLPAGNPRAVPLKGEWKQLPGASVFNANGLAATRGGALLVINSTSGALYQVDPRTGAAVRIRTSAVLKSGDGLLLRGSQLAVVRNRPNRVELLRLSRDLRSARLTATLTDPDFAIPTTIASSGTSLYAVNARFGLPPGPFTIVKVDGS